MMIGARTAAWSGGGMPTAKDYIQDGLIAMWDGIEGEWSNIVGGHEQMEFVGTHQLKNDCVSIDGVNGAYAKVVGLEYSSPCTMEIVCDVKSFESFGRFIAENRGLICTISGFGRLYGFGVDKDIKYFDNPQKRVVQSLTVHNNTASLYVNGVEEGSTSCSSGNYSGTTTFFNRTIGGRGISGDLCCARFYNRDLTAAEIAANYAIDKARFSLPDVE